MLDWFAECHPRTHFDVLTNGRLFSDYVFARELLSGMMPQVTWMVPLYAHAAFLHDYVVQRVGAFDETIGGLLNLQECGQSVQLRVVLIRPVLETLQELCAFIARNLPFVREVALMGCEPIGYALVNREQCEVNLADWHRELVAGVRTLKRGGLKPVLMNTPLCALPEALWPDAHMSISDWKRVFAQDCQSCAVKPSCSGLFSWHERGWRPAPIAAVVREQV